MYLDLAGGHLPLGFLTHTLHLFFFSLIYATCHAYLILSDVITGMKLLKSTNYKVCYSVFLSPLLLPPYQV